MQYSENLKLRREPPSNKWSKEVLLASGNIVDYPQLIKYNEKYVVAYTDGETIYIMAVDNLGKKIIEKSFKVEGDIARSIHVVTDGEKLNVSWITSDKEMKSIYSLILNKKFDVIDRSKIKDVEDLKQVGNDLLVIGFKNTIRLVDYRSGKSFEFEAPLNSMICGTKTGDNYVVAYLNNENNFCYFLVKNGVVTKPKEIGMLGGTTRVSYYNAAIAVEDNKGYILAEYKFQSDFGGSKMLVFDLDGGKHYVRETANKDRVISIFNATSFTDNDPNEKGIKFLAGGYRALGKKQLYKDVLELEARDSVIANSTPISRTRALSGFPSVYGDTAVFCDVIGIDHSNLYMSSYRDDFKKANNTNRSFEYSLAFVDTVQGILFTFVYLVVFGALWIIPSFCTVSILSLIEHRFDDTKRKILFICAYSIALVFKIHFIYTIVFKKFRYYLPSYLTPAIGLGAILIISILCCIYCYKKYSSDLHKNTIAVSFSTMFIIDSWYTLFLFVPFIK